MVMEYDALVAALRFLLVLDSSAMAASCPAQRVTGESLRSDAETGYLAVTWDAYPDGRESIS
jgi:hypothetical protein